MLRVLVTVTPQMYRQAIALSLRRKRPGVEVKIASPEDSGGSLRSSVRTCWFTTTTTGSVRRTWRAFCSASPCSTATAWTRTWLPTAKSPKRSTYLRRTCFGSWTRRSRWRSSRESPSAFQGHSDLARGALARVRGDLQVTFSSPPIISARSRMDPRPRPDRWPVSEAASVSKPFPSSVTVPSSSSG
jgi:hypothetical protein